jgi:hypothetical protein
LGNLATLLTAARRRTLIQIVLEQASAGLCATLGGGVLLLMLGTQILDWWWLAVLFAVGAGWGLWRTLAALPGAYKISQSIDHRLELQDTLSTAFAFSVAGIAATPAGAGELIERQARRANELAGTIDPASAVPWRTPRLLAVAGILAAAAAGMFVVRYGVTGSLDLRSPVVAGLGDFFRPEAIPEKSARKKGAGPGQDQILNLNVDDSNRTTENLDEASEDALRETLTPDIDQMTRDAERVPRAELKAKGEPGDQLMQEDEEGERAGKDNRGDREGGDPGRTPDASQKGMPQQAGNPGANEKSSMLDKMRDAMANLMNKLNIPPQAGSRQGAQKGESQQAKNQGSAAQGAKKGEGQKGQGQPSDDAEGSEEAEASEQAQGGQGKGMDKGADESVSNEPKSGMGKQDGAKESREAEQAAAMGKISEIFGKRAQNIQGEIMLEVKSNKQQQLRTAYSKREATHREAGSDIRRDEIPLELQPFVEQYFEQIRKADRAAPPPAETAKP